MIVRMKFTSSYGNKNKVSKSELDSLIDFLGEDVASSQMKLGEDGKAENKSYRESFSKEEVEKNSDYTLVHPVDMYEIDSNDTYLIDMETFTTKFPSLEFTIKGKPKSVGSDQLNLIEEMKKVADKIEGAKSKFDKSMQFNQRCDVHVPNLGLLNINKLAYATDYCTVELQRLLLQGWRIIAVCAQPDQRRPDYILGMHVSDMDEHVAVEQFTGDRKEKE